MPLVAQLPVYPYIYIYIPSAFTGVFGKVIHENIPDNIWFITSIDFAIMPIQRQSDTAMT